MNGIEEKLNELCIGCKRRSEELIRWPCWPVTGMKGG